MYPYVDVVENFELETIRKRLLCPFSRKDAKTIKRRI